VTELAVTALLAAALLEGEALLGVRALPLGGGHAAAIAGGVAVVTVLEFHDE
jgi:hypothetical protein